MTTTPSRPTPASRATRRSRRPAPRNASFLERNRSRLTWGAAGLVFVLLLGIAFLNFTRPTFACGEVWSPTIPPTTAQPITPPPASPAPTVAAGSAAPSPTPFPSATVAPPGLVQQDQGHVHETNTGATVTYRLCPPASGRHYNAAGRGPIEGGLYGPNDPAVPPGWVHNLEHGAIVLLYSCANGAPDDPCSDAGQKKLEDLLARWPDSPICKFPPGQLSPVIARFDDMAWPYAALVWDVVLPMAAIDEPLLFEFYQRQGEQFNPELVGGCTRETPAPTAVPATPAPSASPAGSGAASPGPSGSPTPSGSAAPAISTAPSPS